VTRKERGGNWAMAELHGGSTVRGVRVLGDKVGREEEQKGRSERKGGGRAGIGQGRGLGEPEDRRYCGGGGGNIGVTQKS